MRTTLLASMLLASAVAVSQPNFCASTEKMEAWFSTHESLRKQYNSARQQQFEILNNGANKVKSTATYTIPVVFHVLHNGGSENVSDAQLRDAIDILNKDFNRQNADTINVAAPFKSMIADVKIHFEIAKIDPNGNCVEGILRHSVWNTLFQGDYYNDYIYTWPHDRYMNIYVVGSLPTDMQAAAYTYLPGSGIPANVDAIVAIHHYVGSIGTGSPGKSRVLTHEVGHWLGLEHVWGWNEVGTYCGDDYIMDTPETKGFQTCNLSNAAQCNPPIVENVENYMDYSYCNKMFTPGQAQWMLYNLNSWVEGRNNLSSPSNLASTGLLGVDDYCTTNLQLIPGNAVTACVGRTVTIMTHTSVAGVNSYSWSADNGAIITSQGTHSTGVVITNTNVTLVNCVATNNAGDAYNSLSITGLLPEADISGDQQESFEVNVIPEGWTALSSNSSVNWQVYEGLGSHGYNSLYIPGEYLMPGDELTLESPAYDLSGAATSGFYFKYAYARASGIHLDRFRVYASADCGTTWTEIYAPGAGQLASGSAGNTASPFLPLDKHWKKYDLAANPKFKAMLGQNNVRLRFYFREDTTGYQPGNRLFLDEINFNTPVGLQETDHVMEFTVYPQPANGPLIVSFATDGSYETGYSLLSVDGKILQKKSLGTLVAGDQTITLNEDHSLTAGLYFLRFQVGETLFTTKVLVQ